MALIAEVTVQLVQVLLLLAVAPLLIGYVRKVRARIMRHRGPPLRSRQE